MATEWQFGDVVEASGEICMVLGLAPRNFEYETPEGDEHSYVGGTHIVLLVIKPTHSWSQSSFGMPANGLLRWAPKDE